MACNLAPWLVLKNSEVMPKKTNTKSDCVRCKVKGLCEGNEFPRIACDTCAHVDVVGRKLSCKHGNSPCDKHIFHPDLMGLMGHEVSDVDIFGEYIEYESGFAMAGEGRKHSILTTYTSTEWAGMFE